MRVQIIAEYVDYFLPREVMGPVILIFSMENVIEILFNTYLPVKSELAGWGIILILSVIFVGAWGEVDDDKEEFEDKIEEMKEENHDRRNRN